ncbi:unnamed protein product [Moneuplotes crassus]|uniref:Transcription initiation factor IIB n=1 Tax=Euplotes crassus TaxID=5936 RepID=A0AAD1US58_EUPCR|nr:unnamed protein product [Moneuplotes crassus]
MTSNPPTRAYQAFSLPEGPNKSHYIDYSNDLPIPKQAAKKRYKEVIKAQMESAFCDDCHTRSVVVHEREGTRVCKNCGDVKEFSMIDESAEWRNMGTEKSVMDRTGGNLNPHLENYGVESNITGTNAEESFMKNANKRFVTTTDRNIKAGNMIMKRFSSQLNLTKACFDMAMDLYSASEKKNILRGKSYEAKLTACIYMACKIVGRPRDLRDLLSVLRVKRRDVTKCYKLIARSMPSAQVNTNYEEKVSALCRNLSITDYIEKACRQCVDIIRERELLTGKNPNTIAGVAIYIVTKDSPCPQSFGQIAEAAGLSEVTIRKSLRYVEKITKELIPKWFLPYIKS